MKKLTFMAFVIFAVVQVSFVTLRAGHAPVKQNVKAAPPATSFTTNEFLDYANVINIDCAGESITLEGTLHVLTHVTINGNNVVMKTQYQPQGVTGTGSISGIKYQGTGGTREISEGSLVNGEYTFTRINNFRIISQGSANNYLVHSTIHTTVNANGTVTSEVDNSTIECK